MRILLAIGRTTLRMALYLVLAQQPGLELLGDGAGDAESLLAQLAVTDPDLVLLDWTLPGRDATHLIPAIRQRHPDIAIIVLCGQQHSPASAAAIGVDALAHIGDPPDRLLQTICSFQHERTPGETVTASG